MVENNDVQDKMIIRQVLKKDAETVFKMTRSLTKYHGEDAEFRATIEDVERDGFGKSPFWLHCIILWNLGFRKGYSRCSLVLFR